MVPLTKSLVKINYTNFNFAFDQKSWLNWLNLRAPAHPKHDERDKYHTAKHRDDMHNKFWSYYYTLDSHMHTVGTSAWRHKSNDDFEIPLHAVVPDKECGPPPK